MSIENDANILQSSLSEDIFDYLEENPVCYFTHVEDIDLHVTKLETLRTKFRNVHKTLLSVEKDNYEVKYGESYQKTISLIKEYMLEVKRRRNEIRLTEEGAAKKVKDNQLQREAEEYSKQESSADFLMTEVNRRLTELKNEFTCNLQQLSDDELLKKKEKLHSHLLNLDVLSNKFQQLLGTIPNNYKKRNEVREITTEYDELITTKATYVSLIEKMIDEKEIIKERDFQTSSLNIRLQKFEGYGSVYDIYSFKSEFEKLYLKSTPKKMLPDLLKNNYLDGPALSLVLRLDDIDEVWKRLKKS